MTLDQYNKLKPLAESMDHIINHGVTPDGSNNVIRDIEKVYKEIFPQSPPVNLSCWSCISDMVRTCWNTYKSFNPPKTVKNILLVNSHQMGGVEYYRMMKPNHVLSLTYPEYKFTSINSVHVEYVPVQGGQIHIDDFLKQFDLIHFCRGISRDGNSYVTDKLTQMGIPFGLDLDDYWDLPKDHLIYNYYKEHNITSSIIDSIKRSQFVTCTTPILAKEIEQLNPNVHVIENGIDIKDPAWQVDYNKTDKMRFGFMQGSTHVRDIEQAASSIVKVFDDRKLKNYQIVLGGFSAKPTNPAKPEPSVYIKYERLITDHLNVLRFNPKYQEYLRKVIEVGNDEWANENYRRVWSTNVEDFGYLYSFLDVSLIPLIATRFNSCKSELKLIEAGAKGKAAIVSDVNPYKLFATDKNSFKVGLYTFYEQIKRCLNNPNEVEDKAAQLRQDVLEKYTLQGLAEKRKQIYDKYINK